MKSRWFAFPSCTAKQAKLLLVVTAFGLFASDAAAVDAVLHNFSGGANDGTNPSGSLVSSGTTLYGMSRQGGSSSNNGFGTIFAMNTDGSGFSLVHKFSFSANDGDTPTFGSLTVAGQTLYGMTSQGGTFSGGTVFKVNTDGSEFSLLHSFAGGVLDGGNPQGSLTLSGSTLYGMTLHGGSNSDFGSVFKLNTDGTGYVPLHIFSGGANDGVSPFGSLTLVGSTLYGMTNGGGSNGYGTIFKINTDGSGFELLHSFNYSTTDGSRPFGSLIVSGSTFYGMTLGGGSSVPTLDVDGTVFKMNLDGTGFSLLHSFAGGASDGSLPRGSLTLSGSTLYGLTAEGGNSVGVAFSINTDGTGYSLLHSFAGGPSDGSFPYGSLTLVESTLYGVAASGGTGGGGVLFSIQVPEPCSVQLLILGIATSMLRRSRRTK